MNVDELLSLDRELTDEEFLFLEQELLKKTKEFHELAMQISAETEGMDPEQAAHLRRHAQIMLENVEAAAALPLHSAGDDADTPVH